MLLNIAVEVITYTDQMHYWLENLIASDPGMKFYLLGNLSLILVRASEQKKKIKKKKKQAQLYFTRF